MDLRRRRARTVPPKDRGWRTIAAVGVGVGASLGWAVLALALAGTGHAEDTHAAAVSQKDVHAKMQYCEVCHGPSARGFVGYYPVPRLAGQQVAYLENQLKGFSERKRANNIMFNVGHVLSPAMMTALATGFHELNPPPLRDAPIELAAEGKKIFTEGVPAADVPPCAGCHGEDAKGNDQFPRLAGQIYPYVVKQLTDWTKERHEEASEIMQPIAHSLTPAQIKAVAAYVNSLE